MKVDISSLKEDISKLKCHIVESPEELKSQMEKMRENVKNIKISIVCPDGALLHNSFHADPDNRVFHLSQFQNESDERVVELQNMVQNVTHAEAEVQQMFNLLQELEMSMNNSKQRQKEVRSECCWFTSVRLETRDGNLCSMFSNWS